MEKNNIKIKKNMLLLCVFIVAILSSIIITMIVKSFNKNKLIGLWTTDGVTIYQFEKDGKGKLILPLSQYNYLYKIDGNKLHIDFESNKTTDSDYIYCFDDDKLIIKGINQTIGTYTFYKQ